MTKIVSLLIPTLISSMSLGYMANPADLDLKPAESKVTGVFIVTNDDKKDLLVNVKLKTKKINEDGVEERGEVDPKEIMVFPSAAKIKPNSTAAFRVFYSGQEKIEIEKNFRIIFTEEKPRKIEDKKEGASAKVIFNTAYANNVNILPSSGKKEPPLVESIVDKDNKKVLTLKNNSNFRVSLKSFNFIAKDKKGKTLKIKTEGIEAMQSLMQAQTRRKITLPNLEGLDAKSIGVELEEIH